MRAILMHSEGRARRKGARAAEGDAKDDAPLEQLQRLLSKQQALAEELAQTPLETPPEVAAAPEAVPKDSAQPPAETARIDAEPAADSRRTRKPTAREARFLADADDILQQPDESWPSLEQLWATLPLALQEWIEALRLDFEDLRHNRIREDDLSTRLLLYGPPGTGKSFIARAFAKSFGAPLISTSYARWAGYKDGNLDDVTFAMKRDFFLAAYSGPCVLFIDEIDTIPSRDGLSSHNRDYWVAFTNALLEELSGSGGRSTKFILLAATNRRDALDPALLRSGRLEKQIELGAPTTSEACEAVLRVHLREELADAPLSRLACCLVGKPAADIEAMTRKARHAARKARTALALEHLYAAADLDGSSRDPAFDRTIALHEAGHAFAHIATGLGERVSCSMTGVTAAEGRPALTTSDTVERRLVALLAGRAAEEIGLGKISSGAGGHDDSDLGKAHALAGEAVLSFGFSRKAPLHFASQASRRAFPPSAREAEEIRTMVATAYRRALGLVRANRPVVQALADALQARRALNDGEIRDVIAAHGGRLRKPRFRVPASARPVEDDRH